MDSAQIFSCFDNALCPVGVNPIELAQEGVMRRLSDILPFAPRGADDKNGNKNGDEGPTTGVVVKSKPKTKKPSMYKVILLNDDYTPMEFVVMVLERFFNKSHEEATRIMLHVHQKGVGVRQ